MIKPTLKLMIVLIALISTSACFSEKTTSNSTSITPVPSNLLVEGNQQPLNVHSATPRLSWHANVKAQVAYQVQVASSEELLVDEQADLWDSGKVIERRSLNIAYTGKALQSKQTAFWRVRIWSSISESPEAWSDISTWEMGLIKNSDWQAQWVQVDEPIALENGQALNDWMLFAADVHPNNGVKLSTAKISTQKRVVEQLKSQQTASLFRHSFVTQANKKIIRTRLHSTAAGYYEVYINGNKVDDRLMDPGQTDYDKRILYNTDAVERFIINGQNTIAVHLGSGWYNEAIAFSRWNNPDADPSAKPTRNLAYGQPAFIAQLEIEYADGTRQLITSNEKWLSHPSPILKEGLFSGEFYDARAEVANWQLNMSDKQLTAWRPVKALEVWPTGRLEPQLLPPIKALNYMKPVAVLNPEEDVYVLDFGQNFTGIPTLNLSELALSNEQAVHLRYAEWVDKAGNISQKSGGGAPLLKQVDTYIHANNKQTWTPIFTWHGFRYVEVRGLNKTPSLSAITANLVRSSVDIAGQFESSDELVNRIHDMALWSYEGNLMALPMDCPIRERAGWTGDAHAALITGNYNYNMDNFWDKYLGDFKTARHIAPAVVPGKRTHGGNFDWAAAEILIAWEHYRHHGMLQLLESQYDSMLEYMVAGEAELDNSLIRKGYGDWCDPVRTPGTPRVNGRCTPQHTSPTITSSALFAYSAKLMAKISIELNKPEQAAHYNRLFEQMSTQFHTEFYDKQSGHYNSQTADAMALMFEIAPPKLRQSIADALNNDVINNWNGHASVGALGQTYLYRALSDYGYAETAFNIFKAKGYPGYDYLFNELNATTLWERKGFYDPKQDPDGSKGPGFSLNHPFHSGYDGWFYEGLGGIRPLPSSIGFQDFALQPEFVTGLQSVEVSYTTGYGKIKSNWQREANKIIWHFSVPNNSTALVSLPNSEQTLYTAGDYSLEFDE